RQAGGREGAEHHGHHPHAHVSGGAHLSVSTATLKGMRRRPPPRRMGAVVLVLPLAALLTALSGCSRNVSVDAPHVSGATARACSSLVDDLPKHVADQRQRDVDADGGYAAAW